MWSSAPTIFKHCYSAAKGLAALHSLCILVKTPHPTATLPPSPQGEGLSYFLKFLSSP